MKTLLTALLDAIGLVALIIVTTMLVVTLHFAMEMFV